MIYLNLGRRETGKTTLAAYLINKAPTRIVLDPRGLFPAVRRLTTPEDIDARFDQLEANDPAVLATLGDTVITPDAGVQECFDVTCERIQQWMKAGRRDIGFLVDELRFVQDTDGPALNWILRCATRDSVTIVFTAHRPVDVPIDIRAISDVWCIFHMTQENDLKVIAERCSPAVSQRVAKLPPRHFISWDDSLGAMQTHAHPERWFTKLAPAIAVAREEPIEQLDGQADRRGGNRFDF